MLVLRGLHDGLPYKGDRCQIPIGKLVTSGKE
jgi:hypothetical protein